MITIDAALTESTPELLAALTRLAAEGRRVTADLIALLAVVAERKVYAIEGYRSLHDFCVQRLLLSESQAYHRIAAALAAWRFPVILERLRDGRLTLTNVALLRQQLTEDNHRQVLSWAERRSKRDVERFVRGLAPLPDVAPSIRKVAERHAGAAVVPTAEDRGRTVPVPEDRDKPCAEVARPGGSPQTGGSTALFAATADRATSSVAAESRRSETSLAPTIAPSPVPPRRADIRPLTPARYSLRLTISEETLEKLRRARDLLGHTVPTGDLAEVLDRALTLLVERLERAKFAARTPKGQSARPSSVPPLPAPPHQPRGTATAAASAENATRSEKEAPCGHSVSLPEPKAVETSGATPAAPKARSRYIPAAVRRAVWERDAGRCAYVGPAGRCGQTRSLEFHHRRPFADGGESTVQVLSLACRLHNRLEAARWFGEDVACAHGRRNTDDDASRPARDSDQSKRGTARAPSGGPG